MKCAEAGNRRPAPPLVVVRNSACPGPHPDHDRETEDVLAVRLLTNRFIADTLARLVQRGPGPRIKPEIAFAEIPARTEQTTISTRHGNVGATIYLPDHDLATAPVYVNFHGGAFVLRHPEQDDPICRYLAAHAGVVVVNVDYDVGPAHRFPEPIEEGYDAAVWAADAARPWDGSRLCVGGQSAGGAISAGVARLALEHGTPRVALQVLHYPPLDLATPGAEKHAAGKSIISVPMTQVADTVYVPTEEAKHHRLASPAWGTNAENIDGIAPALVITCEYDRLHDEGVRYATALSRARALLEHIDLAGEDHGYSVTGADRETVERVYARIAEGVIAATTG